MRVFRHIQILGTCLGGGKAGRREIASECRIWAASDSGFRFTLQMYYIGSFLGWLNCSVEG